MIETMREAKKRYQEHHRKHGDMDGNTCLLGWCAVHYPEAYRARLARVRKRARIAAKINRGRTL